MDPISVNETNTVGVACGYNNISDFCGKFDTRILKEWLDKVLETYGDSEVYLYSHLNSDPKVSARALTASDEYDTDIIQVGCAGLNFEPEPKFQMKKIAGDSDD
jgi:hypothetical protein